MVNRLPTGKPVKTGKNRLLPEVDAAPASRIPPYQNDAPVTADAPFYAKSKLPPQPKKSSETSIPEVEVSSQVTPAPQIETPAAETTGSTSTSSTPSYSGYSGGISLADKPATPPVVKKAKGIDPAFLTAGMVSAAGLGAAALSQNVSNKEKPTALENAGMGIVSALDGVAGVAGTALGFAHPVFMPAMIGMTAVDMAASSLTDKAGNRIKATGRIGKMIEGAERITQGTFSDVGKLISPKLGKDLSRATEGAIKASAPVLDTMSHAPGLKHMHSKQWEGVGERFGKTTVMHGFFRTAMLTGATLGLYGVARNFGSQLHALRQLYADLTDKKIENISSIDVLTSTNLPKAVLKARDQLLAVSGVHAIASAAGLAMVIKDNAVMHAMGKVLGPMAGGMGGMLLVPMVFSLPEQVAELAETFMGTPILAHYKGLSDAQKSGQAIPAEAIAEFIFVGFKDLKDRGHTGQVFAMEIAKQYVDEGAKMAAIVEEMYNSKLKARIDDLKKHNHKPAANDTKTVVEEAPKELSHVERLQQRMQAPLTVAVRPELQVYGDFTQKIKQAKSTPATPTLGA